MAEMTDWRQRRSLRARARATGLAAAHGHRDARDLMRVMFEEEFPGEIAIASSFGAEAVALLALAAEVEPSVPVIFLDTGRLFPETIAYRDTVVAHLGLRDVLVAQPDVLELAAAYTAGDLWSQRPDACCFVRKVKPLVQAVTPYAAWITGRKRYQGATRQELAPIEASDRWVKVNPLARWTKQDVFRLIASHGLPRHPLLAQGYVSIGCAPCTRSVAPLEDERDGRWAGSGKTECGIHTFELGEAAGHESASTVAGAR